jgi:hypothetical protein
VLPGRRAAGDPGVAQLTGTAVALVLWPADASAGQLQVCWVQLTPLGVQMPQVGLQQDVPGAQIVPPHVPLSGASASVAGTGSDCGAAGAGHSGQNLAQSGAPLQPMHCRSGGWHAGTAASSAGAACGAHSGQCSAQISAPLQPMHCRSGGWHVSAVASTAAGVGPGVARDTSGDRAHAASARPIDAISIMRRGLRDSFRMRTPLVMCERARRSTDARALSIDVNRAHINRVTDGEPGYAARAVAPDRPILTDACRARSCAGVPHRALHLDAIECAIEGSADQIHEGPHASCDGYGPPVSMMLQVGRLLTPPATLWSCSFDMTRTVSRGSWSLRTGFLIMEWVPVGLGFVRVTPYASCSLCPPYGSEHGIATRLL